MTEFKIVALMGEAGSGKGTVAKWLVDNLGYMEFSFASHLKDVLSVLFGWDRDLLEGNTPESREWRKRVDPYWSKVLGNPDFSPRWAMQNVSEAIKAVVGDEFFTHWLMRYIDSWRGNAVVSDVRYRHEITALERRNAEFHEVVRNNRELTDPKQLAHISEQDWRYKANDIRTPKINNTGTTEDLYRRLPYIFRN